MRRIARTRTNYRQQGKLFTRVMKPDAQGMVEEAKRLVEELQNLPEQHAPGCKVLAAHFKSHTRHWITG